MRAKRYLLFILLNIIVSIMTTLGVLSFKGELERVVVVTATPGATLVAPASATVSASQVAAATPDASATPALGEYEIREGDTLLAIALNHDIALEDLLVANNLAEDDIIQPGQTLIIPLNESVPPAPATPDDASPVSAPPPTSAPDTPTPGTPTSFPTDTPTPSGPLMVRIEELLAPGNLAREGVVLVNRGRTVNLHQWTLGAAGAEKRFVFPRLTLAQGVPVTVYTVSGRNSPQELHWGLDEAQWGKSGTLIELRDAEGELITRYTVP